MTTARSAPKLVVSIAMIALACSLSMGACAQSADPPPSCAGGFRGQCIADVALGTNFGCARLGDESVWCWGRNDQGQLGYATTDVCPEDLGGGNGHAIACHTFPFQVPGLDRVVGLAAASAFTCAQRADGTVRCWGGNAAGQLGDGNTLTSQTPVDVTGLAGVTSLAVGGDHACALVAGQVKCWGANDRGQIGVRTTETCKRSGAPIPCSTEPVNVEGLSNVVAIASGALHTCALLADATVTCWGDNTWAQLGRGFPGLEDAPPPPLPNDGGSLDSGTGDAGDAHAGSDHDGGGLDAGPPPITFQSVMLGRKTTLSNVLSISSTGATTCALRDGGDVYCWGRGDHGELGSPKLAAPTLGCPGTCSGFAITVADIQGMASIDAGNAVDAGKPIDAGTSDSGAIADKDASMPSEPDAAPTGQGTDDRNLANGESFACVSFVNGTARCWGSDTVGQLGDGMSTTASRGSTLVVAAPGAAADNPLVGVAKVRAGTTATCAVMNDHSVRCWGSNLAGALGLGHFSPVPGPMPVAW